MKKILLIVSVIGILSVAGSASYYIAIALPKIQKANQVLEERKLEQQAKNEQAGQDKESELNECLAIVEADYKRKVELNSVSAPTEEYSDARRWNSSQIKLDVEQKYNDDRDFCLKLYKDQ